MKELDHNIKNRLAKEYIFIALMILMEKKTFTDISITEITSKAGVSRMAYYRNYISKEHILTDYLDELFEEYLNEVLACKDFSLYQFAYKYFAYLRNQERLLKNLIKSNLVGLLIARFDLYLHSIFEDILDTKPFPKEIKTYMVQYIVGGVVRVLIGWINGGMKEDDDTMAKVVCKLSNDEYFN